MAAKVRSQRNELAGANLVREQLEEELNESREDIAQAQARLRELGRSTLSIESTTKKSYKFPNPSLFTGTGSDPS